MDATAFGTYRKKSGGRSWRQGYVERFRCRPQAIEAFVFIFPFQWLGIVPKQGPSDQAAPAFPWLPRGLLGTSAALVKG